MSEPMILVDAAVRTPSGRDFWSTEEMYDEHERWPSWNTAQASMTFFGLRRHSLLRHIKLGHNFSELTGAVLPPRRDGGTEAYIWRLWDIERMAHALAAHKQLNGGRLSRTILMVKTCAEVHGFL